MKRSLLAVAVLSTFLAMAAPAQAAQEMSDRFIVRMKPALQQVAADRREQVQQALRAAARAGVAVTHWRRMGLGAEVIRLSRPVPVAQARRLAQRIGLQEGVEWAVVSQRRHIAAAPNDPEFSSKYTLQELTASQGSTAAAQIIADFGLVPHLWYLDPVQPTGDLKTLAMSVNWMPAWERTAGFSDRNYRSVVAVIDTGIVAHGDLDSSRVLAGYDFIHDSPTARDGSGRDANPRDEGDWNTSSECEDSDSSWHGTFVAGIIGATANNGVALAGINPQAAILPIRTLGKCGGYDEDIIDGALWAGGLSVQNPGLGLPAANANPAQVVNFSLGGPGICDSAYQSMVNQLNASGVVVVAAAGNSRENVASFAPANCDGVIAVASNSRAGALADYSNFGSDVAISAPGGGTTFMVTSTSNAGKTVAGADSVDQERGTSFSAPMVAAAASLVKSFNAALTPDQVLRVLQQSASAFPPNIDCNVTICGVGVLNIDNAAQLAGSGLLASRSLLRFSAGLGATVSQHSFTLNNGSGSTLTLGVPGITSTSSAASDFTFSHNCPLSLAPAASCQVTVNFAPTAAGGRYAVLELPAAGSILRVALYGINGGPVLTADPAGGLSFSGTAGRVTASKRASFTNSSAQGLSFGSSAINLPSEFMVDAIRCDGVPVSRISDCLLPPGMLLELDVVFAPGVTGSTSGNLTVKPAEGSLASIALQGSATASGSIGGSEGGGGGCSVAAGQRDVALLLLPLLFLLRRRRSSACA